MISIRKVYSTGDERISRLHDLQGNMVTLDEVALLPQRFIEYMSVRRQHYSEAPWWPSKATQHVESILRPDFNVLEFGAGMSTVWLAKRVRRVTAVDVNPEWRDRVTRLLSAEGLANAEILLRTRETYTEIDPPLPIDLVIIDGARREDCLDWALTRLQPGSFIYLDNSDREGDSDNGLVRARMLALSKAGRIETAAFRGYPPGLLAPTEGMLARVLPNATRT
jgi:hypothetical protein